MNIKKRAYFDNAATSYPKPEEVYAFADAFYRECGASIGRGQYREAAHAAKILEEDREMILELMHCGNKQVVFTPSATEAINSIIRGSRLPKGSTVYYSPFEHNAVTRVLRFLENEDGITTIELPFDVETLEPDYQAIEELFARNEPDMLIVTHASNVIGLILPIEDLAKIAKEHGAINVIDMSQTAGLLDVDLSSDYFDYAVFAGHKTLLGPFGIGGFVCKTDAMLQPIIYGGNGVDSANQDVPIRLRDRVEVGSLNTYAIAGLNAALKYLISKRQLESAERIDLNNRKRILDSLKRFSEIEIVGDKPGQAYIAVVSARFRGYSSDEMGKALDRFGVAVRSGMQCAPGAHKFLGTFPSGTIRFSAGALTTEEDFAVLDSALKSITSAL